MRRALLALVVVGLAAAVGLGWSGSASAVSTAATSTTLAVSPGSIALDGEFTLTATVTGTSVPQGSVRFWSGGDLLATQTVTPVPGSSTQATATVTLTNWFSAGAHPLTASFVSNGVVFWGNSESAAVTLNVGGVVIHNTTTTLTASPSPATAGQPVTLTAVVTRDDGVTPTGTVTFRDGGTLVGTVDLVGGVATLVRSDFPAGPHALTASYLGPTTDVASSSGAATLSITAAVTPNVVDTTTTAWSEPTAIQAGDTVVLYAHVVQVGTQTPPPGGPIVTFRDATSTPSTFLGEAALDADGNASIEVSGWGEGTYRIRAEYVGDLLDRPSAGTFTIVVAPAPTGVDTTLAVASATAAATKTATLSATLTADGVPVVGETVTLAAGGQTCTATTGDDGTATCTVPAPATAGSYPITATHDDSPDYNASTGSSTLVVTKLPTSLAVPAVTVGSGTATLAATLTTGSTPLAGKQVTLTVGTQSCTATTTAAGLASCTIAFAQAAGTYTLGASFAGDDTYSASAGAGTLTATAVQTSLLVFPSLAIYHHSALLSARLTDASGAVAGKTVTLTVGSRSCTDTTDSFGLAVCTITVDTLPGTAPILGTFAGAVGYVGSTGTSTIAIAKQPTSLTIVSSLVQQSGTVAVTAKLLDDNGNPIANAPVTLTLGTTSTTATTNAAGIATATFVRSAGSYAVSAHYAGSAVYVGSSDANGDKLTCYDESRFLVWGGNDSDLDRALRVGDHVTFWGAQWSKQVVRGDYGGGSSLKGWADNVSGSSWSTGTGNSVSAPRSVATYVSVIVTTHVKKSGSTISGDVARRIVLRVDDPGAYDANPGHAAAGTVVAIL